MAIVLEEVRVEVKTPRGEPRTLLDIDRFEIAGPKPVCVVGASGSGKTTLLHCIAGIVAPTVGRVVHGDVDIAALSEPMRDRFRARHVGYVFQTFNLLGALTCLENVVVASMFAGNSEGAEERARLLLERVGLAERCDDKPGVLSVGEQQRVAIARALINRPSVLLADEPTANLDEEASDKVLSLLDQLVDEEECTMVLVTHESRVYARFEQVVPITEINS